MLDIIRPRLSLALGAPKDVTEILHDIKQRVKHVLWCDHDGLKESRTVNTSKTRKRSKNDSESDSDDVVETVANKKKKQCCKDEKLEVVSELKALHGQQYTPMQYRIGQIEKDVK